MNTRSNDELKIIPIKKDEKRIKKNRRQFHPNLPDINSGVLLLLAGSIKSGKSSIIQNILHRSCMFANVFPQDAVTIISPTIAQCTTSRFSFQKWKNNCFEIYDDKIIIDLVKKQKEKMKDLENDCGYCVVVDDSLGRFSRHGKKDMAVIYLASRFRHLSGDDPALMIYSSQKWTDIHAVLRGNATDILISGSIKNKKELEAIFSDYEDCFGGRKKFTELYSRAQQKPFDWLYLKMSETPAQAFLNFTERLV
jgi:hypothetical protein